MVKLQRVCEESRANLQPEGDDRRAESVEERQPARAPSEKLTPAIRHAFRSFEAAERAIGRQLEDRAAYDWLHENGIPDDAETPEEYELPHYPTWERYVRKGRRAMAQGKYSPRSGRTGRSIATPDEL